MDSSVTNMPELENNNTKPDKQLSNMDSNDNDDILQIDQQFNNIQLSRDDSGHDMAIDGQINSSLDTLTDCDVIPETQHSKHNDINFEQAETSDFAKLNGLPVDPVLNDDYAEEEPIFDFLGKANEIVCYHV